MSAPNWITNDADADELEGLYIKEETPTPAVAGVSLTGCILAGVTVRGPVNTPIDISGGRLEPYFGGRDYGSGAIVNELWRAGLGRKFGTVWGVRVAAASVSKATKTLYTAGGVACLRVDAFGPGADGLNISAAVENATDGVSTSSDVVVSRRGTTTRLKNVNVNSTGDNTLTVLSDVWRDANLALVTLTKLAAGRPVNSAAAALVGGGDGAVAEPAAPVVTNQGTPGAAARSYKVVGRTSTGFVTAASAAGSTATGHAAPDGTNFDRVTWVNVAGAYEYRVYRSAGGATQGLIGTVSAGAVSPQLDDTGLVGDGTTAPGANTTAALAATDYTATGKAIDVIMAKKGVGIVAVVGVSSAHQAAVNAAMLTAAATAQGRTLIIGAPSEATTLAEAGTDAGSYRHERLRYAFGHRYRRDLDGSEMLISPIPLMASILSQSDADQHMGREEAKQYASDTIRLYHENLLRSDYIAARKAGVCALEQDEDEQYVFVSGVTTSLEAGKDQDTRRRTADAILLALAAAWKTHVKETATTIRRAAIERSGKDYLGDLQRAERMVEAYSLTLPTPSPSTPRRQEVLLNVDLINHILALLVRARIGDSVEIEEVN
jgi:hypothetical protein